MKHKFMSFTIAAAALIFIALPVVAAENEGVTVELTNRKAVAVSSGKEKFESAEKAKPGDVIEYKAVYRNKGKNPAANVMATIPVPLGTEYIPGSAKPSKVMASSDGKEYAPVPLKKKVTLPSGQTEMRAVPYEEYRFMRWELKKLSPAESATVSMRVKISTAPLQTNAPLNK